MRKILFGALLLWLGYSFCFAAPVMSVTPSQALTLSSIQYLALSEQEQRTMAETWGITQQEYAQYLTLMTSTSGHWYAQLDPAEVLGINAKTDDEREHYALIVAKAAFTRTTQELAFQKAYDLAFKSLYGNIKPIALPSFKETPLLVRGDRLLLFIKLESELPTRLLPRLMSLVQSTPETSLNVFFKSADDPGIRAWAGNHHLPINLVQTKRITLNHDNGLSSQWLKGQLALPLLLRERAGQLTPIALSEGL